ncbi:MAG: tRNA adenosine(34) deaminase TadA [Spirochaetota bacterium]
MEGLFYFQDTMQNDIHHQFMQEALREAEAAGKKGEIPCGAVIVCGGTIIARGHNTNRLDHNPTRHAEIVAIERAAAYLKYERLLECSLYVTKEPCVMCAGAIIHSRIKTVYIGSRDEKYGACGTRFSILGDERFNHRPEIIFGVCGEETTSLIKHFFAQLREKKKAGS